MSNNNCCSPNADCCVPKLCCTQVNPLDSFNCLISIIFWVIYILSHATAGLYAYLHFSGNCDDFTVSSVILAAASAVFAIASNLNLLKIMLSCHPQGCFNLVYTSFVYIMLGAIALVSGVMEVMTRKEYLHKIAYQLGIVSGSLGIVVSLITKLLFWYCCGPDTTPIPCCCPQQSC
ncbi:unnamed protein product [Phyllotreta striolata]|uniref:Uncharacterized protein n=1 Tax=Phyllotreta striolata TaxID=444603 RepID=A0A9N9TS03_PHYSR|nr:unnamed protein product [Phyllotreta striolata]